MNLTNKKRAKIQTQFLILFLIILVSGNPAFSSSDVTPWILLPLTTYVVFIDRKIYDINFLKKIFLFELAFLFIFLAHAIQFGSYPIATWLFFLFKILAGGFALQRIGPRFPERLFSVVFFISFVSLLCYLALLILGPEKMLGMESPELFGENVKTMLIFTTLMTDQWWRNSAMFWEPGAFQAIINLSLSLLPLSSWLEPSRRFRMICVLLALITTFSTTGYLLFFIILTVKITQIRQSWVLRVPLISFAIALSVFATFQLDFIGAKILGQIERSLYSASFSPDRFGSLFFDIHYIEKNPVFGNGLIQETRLADHPELHNRNLGHSNGLSNFIATFGFFGALLYFLSLLSGRTGVRKGDRIILTVVVIVIAFSEQFLTYALFLGLPFLYLTHTKATVTSRTSAASAYRRHDQFKPLPACNISMSSKV
ncbi:hypothetical protein GRI34_05420 [Erythrobacter aquimaris]|uniref:O-antigen ligase domain-containing protein n=1 Tax=Qipengyuania aquimaris TaxID=255984 RepID=A0A6I4TKZ1_9SPHN|nr:hypothetical protein [Qipengyuania aquimaris]MXO95860.1 hypothetical protein [Qipengyuania aquimaris]